MATEASRNDDQAFAIGQSGLWPFATLSATFLWLFQGWLFPFLAALPVVFIIYGNLWALAIIASGAAILAALQQAFAVRLHDVQRWVRGLVNPKRRPAYPLPPRWPRE